MQLQVVVQSASQGRNIWDFPQLEHDLIAAIDEKCRSFFFIFSAELDIES
jgi:hypothetical protein